MQNWRDLTRIISTHPPKGGIITTYNLWTGLLNWRGPTPTPPFLRMSSIQQVIHLMNQTKEGLTIIVTIPSEYQQERISLEAHHITTHFPKITIKQHPGNHTKIIALYYPKSVLLWNSSRNFHETRTEQYHEITTQITDPKDKQTTIHLLQTINREAISIFEEPPKFKVITEPNTETPPLRPRQTLEEYDRRIRAGKRALEEYDRERNPEADVPNCEL